MDTLSKINTIKTIVDIDKVLKKNIKTLGVNTDNFYNFLKEKVDIEKVLESDIDFTLNTINITTLRKLYLSKEQMGDKLIDYILTSSSATPVLQPRKIKNGIFTNYYIDGGFLMDYLSKKLWKMGMRK